MIKELSDICNEIIKIAKENDDDSAVLEIGAMILDIKNSAYNEGLSAYHAEIAKKISKMLGDAYQKQSSTGGIK